MIPSALRPLAYLTAGLLTGLSGCASQTAAPKAGTADPCVTLKEVIAAYPTGFQQYRGSSTRFSYATIYKANEEIIADSCQIWEWSAGVAGYVCNLPAPNAETGRVRYQNALDKVQGCLGAGWSAHDIDRFKNDQNKGVATILQAGDQEPVVAVHALENDGLFNDQATTYLYIGPSGQAPK